MLKYSSKKFPTLFWNIKDEVLHYTTSGAFVVTTFTSQPCIAIFVHFDRKELALQRRILCVAMRRLRRCAKSHCSIRETRYIVLIRTGKRVEAHSHCCDSGMRQVGRRPPRRTRHVLLCRRRSNVHGP